MIDIDNFEFNYLDPFAIKVKPRYHHSFSKLMLLLPIEPKNIMTSFPMLSGNTL